LSFEEATQAAKVGKTPDPTSRCTCCAAPKFRSEWALRVDAVEKGKNERINFFTCAPVEAVISQSNTSQRA
jgi:hypothetical protein